MSFDFSHLHIKEATARMDLPWLNSQAYVIVRPANDDNKGYQRGMLALSGNRQRAIAIGGKISLEDAEKDRNDDRTLYPRHIIVNWGGIFNTEKKEISYSPEAGEEFCNKIPNWLFDKIRVFSMRPENFIKHEDEMPPDPVELAKN